MDGSSNAYPGDEAMHASVADGRSSTDAEHEQMDESALEEHAAEHLILTAPEGGPVPPDTVLDSPQKPVDTTTTSSGSNPSPELGFLPGSPAIVSSPTKLTPDMTSPLLLNPNISRPPAALPSPALPSSDTTEEPTRPISANPGTPAQAPSQAPVHHVTPLRAMHLRPVARPFERELQPVPGQPTPGMPNMLPQRSPIHAADRPVNFPRPVLKNGALMWQNLPWSVQRNYARVCNFHIRTTLEHIFRQVKEALYKAMMRDPTYMEVRVSRLANQTNAQGMCIKGEDWNNVYDGITRILNNIGASGMALDWDLNVFGYLGHLTDSQQLGVPGIDPFFAPSTEWHPHFIDVTHEYSRPVMTSTQFLSAGIPSNLWRTDENQERNMRMAVRFLVPEGELRFNEPPEPTYPSELYTRIHQPSFAFGRSSPELPPGTIEQNRRTMHLQQCPTIAGMYAYYYKGFTAHSGGDLAKQLPFDIQPAPMHLTVMPATVRPTRPTAQANVPSASGQAGSRNIRPSRLPLPGAQGASPAQASNQPRAQGPVMPSPQPAAVMPPTQPAAVLPRPPHPHGPVYALQGPPDSYSELLDRAAARNPPLLPSPYQYPPAHEHWAVGPGWMQVTPYKCFPNTHPAWDTLPPYPVPQSAEWLFMKNLLVHKRYNPDIRWIEIMAELGFLENALKYGFSIGPHLRAGFVPTGVLTDYGERCIDLPATPTQAELDWLPPEWNYIPAVYVSTQDACFFFTRKFQPVYLYCSRPPYNGTLWWRKGRTTLNIQLDMGGSADSETEDDDADDTDHESDDSPPDDAPGGGPSGGPPRGPPPPPPNSASSSDPHGPSSQKRRRSSRGSRPGSGLSFNELDFEPFEVDDQEHLHDPFLIHVDEAEYQLHGATFQPIDIPDRSRQRTSHSAPAPKRTHRSRKERDRLRSDGATARAMPPPREQLPAKRKTSRRHKSQSTLPREPPTKMDRLLFVHNNK